MLKDPNSSFDSTMYDPRKALHPNYLFNKPQKRESYTENPPTRFGYNPRIYEGGLLPRLKTSYPLKGLPEYKPKDFWHEKRALRGQNDYIDMLGNGRVHPKDFVSHHPSYYFSEDGGEMRRIAKRLNEKEAYYREFEPTRLHLINKRREYLYKWLNRRRHRGYWAWNENDYPY